jgi:hypothetical protein
MVPVQEQPREGNGERQERCPATEQPRARATTLPTRGRTCENDRHANKGANIEANTDSDAPPLFRLASQNLAVAAMLLRGCPEAATSEERRVRQQLKALLKAAAAQQAKSSPSHQWSERGRVGAPSAHGPNPPPSWHQDHREGGRVAASTVKSRLGPDRDARKTIEAHRWAETVDNHRDNRSCHHNDRGCTRHYESNDDCDRSWLPNQRVRELSAGASEMRGFPRISGLRPMYLGTTGTPTPVCGSKTTGSHATREERQMTSSSSRTNRSTSMTLHGCGSSTCHATKSAVGLTYTGSSSGTSKARTLAPASGRNSATASNSRERACASTSGTSPRHNQHRRHLGVSEQHGLHLPHPPTWAPHALYDPRAPRHHEQPRRWQ